MATSEVRCRSREGASRCAYCHEAAGPEAGTCTGCGTLLHAECATALRACPTLGCRVPLPRPVGGRAERSSRQPGRLLRAWRRWVLGTHPPPPGPAPDAVLGIVVPWLCVVFDPAVFRSMGLIPPFLGGLRWGIYPLIALHTLLLAAWLVPALRPAGRAERAAYAGALLSGAVAAVALGVLLLPLSLLGMLLLVGVLGFTPFVTTTVFLRRGLEAWRLAGEAPVPEGRRGGRSGAVLLGVLLALFPAVLLQAGLPRMIEKDVEQLVRHEPGTPEQRAAVERLRRIHALYGGGDFHEIGRRWYRHSDGPAENPMAAYRLRAAYHQITGRDVAEIEHLFW